MIGESEVASRTADPASVDQTRFTLMNRRGQRIGSIAVAIRSNTITLSYENRVLAQMERDTFRAWLTEPQADALQVHHVIWFRQSGTTCISIKDIGAYAITASSVDHLATVI